MSIEMVADRYDNDDKLLERGCKDLQIDKRKSTLSLFTLAGAVIPCEEMMNLIGDLGSMRMVQKGVSKLKQDWPKTCEHLIINNCPNFDNLIILRQQEFLGVKTVRICYPLTLSHSVIMQAVDIRVK